MAASPREAFLVRFDGEGGVVLADIGLGEPEVGGFHRGDPG